MRWNELCELAADVAERPAPVLAGNFRTKRFSRAGSGVVTQANALSFQRASEAFTIGAGPVLTSVAAHVLADAYDAATNTLLGVRLSERAENIWLNSHDPSLSTLGNVTVTKNAGTAAAGSAIASLVAPTTTNGTHAVGQTLTFKNGAVYLHGIVVKASGGRYLRGYLPGSNFPNDYRVATFDLTAGIVLKQENVLAGIEAMPNGTWLCWIMVRCNTGGSGACGWQINSSLSTASQSFTGSTAAGFLVDCCFTIPLTANTLPRLPIRSGATSGIKEEDSLNLLVDDGSYDLYVETGNGTKAWVTVNAVDGGGVMVPLPLPGGDRVLAAFELFQTRQVSDSRKRILVPDTLPAKVAALRASSLALGAVASWASSDGAPGAAAQSDTSLQPVNTALLGGNAVRFQTSALTLSGLSRPTPLLDRYFLIAFRPIGTGVMTILGGEGVAGSANVFFDATSRVVSICSGAANYAYSLANSAALPEGDGTMTVVGLGFSGSTLRVIDVDGTVGAPLSSPGTGTLYAAGAPTLGRTSSGTGSFDGYLAEYEEYAALPSPGQRERAMGEMRERVKNIRVPSFQRLFADGVTATSARFNFDQVGSTTAGIAVFSDAAGTTAVNTPVEKVPVLCVGQTTTYQNHTIDVTGLKAGTKYWYGPSLNGIVDKTRLQSFTTAPTPGTPASFAVHLASCSKNNTTDDTVSLNVMATQDSAFVLQVGDLNYNDDPTLTANPKYAVDMLTRYSMRNPGYAAIIKAKPLVYIYDDHDAMANNSRLDRLYGTVSGAAILANCLQSYLTTVPAHGYADPQRRVAARYFDWGHVRFIILDTRMQRSLSLATVLGDPTKDPSHFDQMAWLQATLLSAASAGIEEVFMISPTGIPFGGDEAWQDLAPQELRAIYDFVGQQKSLPLVWFATGDYHVSFDSDGTATDMSSDGNTIIFITCSSPLYNNHSTGAAQAVARWNGVSTLTNDKNRTFKRLVFVASPRETRIEEWVRSVSSSPVTMELKVTRSTLDATPTIIPEKTAVDPRGFMRLQRTWRGRASVKYAWSSGAASGTATWGNNNRFETIPAPTVPGTYTLTLSDPSGATLPSTSITVTIADDAALSSYLAAGLSGSDARYRLAYRNFYYGVKDDGVLASLDQIRILGAGETGTAYENMAKPGTYPLTPQGTVIHTPGAGVASDGTGYLTSTYDPAAGGTLFARDSNFMLLWQTAGSASDRWAFGNTDFGIRPQGASGVMEWRDATATILASVVASPTGRFAVSRTGATYTSIYKDGVLQQTHGRASSDLSANQPWSLLRAALDTSGAARGAFAFITGAGLTAAQVGKLDARLVALKAALAALVGQPQVNALIEAGDSYPGLTFTRSSTGTGDVP